ncbi:MAG: phospholipid carrier-dependent glycosyltransferase, partial [Candidatus Electrothrix sp. AR3]|nr:phospholipid carrier-dependent glycosyltransferase [Candidatus Electrothrix sp. AR3]
MDELNFFLLIAIVLMFLSIFLWAQNSVRGRTHHSTVPFRAGEYSQAHFLNRIVLWGFFLRLSIVILFNITDAIRVLHLSPDSLRYHRVGRAIAQKMEQGMFNWPNWIDNGWFQFTGFVYYLFGSYPQIIQLINITLGALTPVIVYYMLRKVYADERVARWTAVFTSFFPSFIYWSCLMLKDPLSIFSMSLLLLAVVSIR